MSTPIGPGDWVECVDVAPSVGWPPPPILAVGQLWEVAQAFIDPEGDFILRLVGYPHSSLPCHEGWRAERFRPIYRPSESLFLERLMDVPADPELDPA